MRIRQKQIVIFFSKNTKKKKKKKIEQRAGRRCSELGFVILEREGSPSLYICVRSNHRFSMEKEAKSIYAARVTHGHRFGGVPTTPRGRDLFLLVIFFG